MDAGVVAAHFHPWFELEEAVGAAALSASAYSFVAQDYIEVDAKMELRPHFVITTFRQYRS